MFSKFLFQILKFKIDGHFRRRCYVPFHRHNAWRNTPSSPHPLLSLYYIIWYITWTFFIATFKNNVEKKNLSIFFLRHRGKKEKKQLLLPPVLRNCVGNKVQGSATHFLTQCRLYPPTESCQTLLPTKKPTRFSNQLFWVILSKRDTSPGCWTLLCS